MTGGLGANAERFAGFADLYDAVRPTPPADLAALLARYAGGAVATVVDLGCGTGLSTRWAATWADQVIGVEPGADMRAIAAATASPEVRVVDGWAHDTGLADGCADVVLAVQAFHWMEPASTLAEAARLLRPGGVFAAVDCDWPPSVGSAAAERAWARCRRRIAEEETRLGGGDPTAVRINSEDAHLHRTTAGGVRSWSKSQHLANLEASGRFAWCHEVVLHAVEEGDAGRFVALLRSQGDYQQLRRAGIVDAALGVDSFEAQVAAAMGAERRPFVFSYRARIGVLPESGDPGSPQ